MSVIGPTRLPPNGSSAYRRSAPAAGLSGSAVAVSRPASARPSTESDAPDRGESRRSWGRRRDESVAATGGCCGGRAGDRVPARLATGREHRARAACRRSSDGDAVAVRHLAPALVDRVDERVSTPGQEIGTVELDARNRGGLAAVDE